MSNPIPKYQKYLYLTLDQNNIDYDKYEYDEVVNNLCVFCGSKCKMTYITYIHAKQIKTKACYFCHIVMNFKKYHIGKVLLIKSDLGQSMVNKVMMEHYYGNGEMMTLEELDENATVIPIQSFEFANLMSHADKKVLSSVFKEFVVFFTEEMTKLLVPTTKNIFIKQSTVSDLKFASLDYPIYKLTDDEECELNNLKKKKMQFEQESCKLVIKNMENKLNNTKKLIKIIEHVK